MGSLTGINTIRWQELPWTVECPWYESSKVRHATSCVLLTLSGGSLGGTYYFSNVSIDPKLARQLTITALVMAVLALILRQIPLFGRDPAYLLQERQLIHQNLQNNPSYGYKDIPQRCLNHREIDTLLHHDIQQMTYSDFEQKHGPAGLDFVSEAHPYSVKLKFFDHIKEKVLRGENSFEASMAAGSYEKLNISSSELQTLKADCQVLLLAQNKGSAQEFIQQAAPELVLSISDPKALHYLLQDYEKSFEDQTYDQLKLGSNVVCLASKHKQSRESLQDKFLRLPYHLLTNAKYESDRQFLGITADKIKQTLRARWEAISFNDNKFCDRSAFFASAQREFSPYEWTQKVLHETRDLTIFEIARRWPELIQTQILKANSALPRDASVRKRLEREIFDCLTCEEFIDKCTPALLASKWIDPYSHAVAFLAADFIDRNPTEFLNYKPSDYRFGTSYNSFHYMHFLALALPPFLHKLQLKLSQDYATKKAAITAKNQMEIDMATRLQSNPNETSAQLEARLGAKKNELSQLLDELWKETLRVTKEKISSIRTDTLLKMNDFSQIVKKLETNADLCKRFSACLFAHRAEPIYAKLKDDFVQWVETKAREGKLPLVFARNINAEAERLFKNKFRFINGNETVPINTFVVHALATQTKSSISGLVRTKLNEFHTEEICTHDDTNAFAGLMEFYKTGTLTQFINLHRENEEAITRLWELADRMLLPEIQDLLKHEFELAVDLPEVQNKQTSDQS